MLVMDDTKSTYLLTKNHRLIDKTTHTTMGPFFSYFPLFSHRYSNIIKISMVLLAHTWCKVNPGDSIRVTYLLIGRCELIATWARPSLHLSAPQCLLGTFWLARLYCLLFGKSNWSAILEYTLANILILQLPS